MPPIYLLDDYDKCFQETITESTYCYVQSFIKPDELSPLSKQIQEFSSDYKRHFRHDYLNRGICLNWCIDRIKNLYDFEHRNYYQSEFPLYDENATKDVYFTEPKQFDYELLPNALIDFNKYNEIINVCINYDLKMNYNLMAYTEVQYCLRDTDSYHIDYYDYGFLIVTLILGVVITIATLYDYYSRWKAINSMKSLFFEQSTNSSIFSYFSIPRNFHKLFSTKNSTEIAEDLQSMHAIRVITMFTVILAHCAMALNILPMQNPQYIEQQYYRLLTAFIYNGTIVIQTFLLLSGFLLSVQFEKMKLTKEFNINYLWKSIVYRYLRLVPSYFYMLYLNATWYARLYSGPVWPILADAERLMCRKNWWTNALFINNMYKMNEPCMQQTWYLGADFQLFIIGIILHLIIWRFPKSTKFVFALAISAAYIIPAVITYYYHFDGVFVIRPQEQRTSHRSDNLFFKYYIATHMNFGAYLCGLIGGILYYKCKYQWNVRLNNYKVFCFAWYMVVPAGVSIILSGYLFYAYEWEKPQLWIAIAASLNKNVWGIVMAVLVIGSAYRIGSVIRKFLQLKLFIPLGHLTYSAYLVHPDIIRMFIGGMRQPNYVNELIILSWTITSFAASYVLGFVLYIGIELPTSNILKRIFQQRSSAVNAINNNIETNNNNNAVELLTNNQNSQVMESEVVNR